MEQALKLNDVSVIKARNQYRVWQYLQDLSNLLKINIASEKYLADALIKQQLLNSLVRHLQIEDQPTESEISIFDTYDLNFEQRDINIFVQNIRSLNKYSQNIDKSIPSDIPFTNYFGFLSHFIKILSAIQKIETMPKLDFNSDEFILDYSPSDEEVKIMINLEGIACLDVSDINKDLKKEPKFYQNNLWAVYIITLLGACGLQISQVNIAFYIQTIGATATQVTNQITYFNLVQLFFSVFWLWASDKIGRKPVYIIMALVYTFTTGLFLLTVNINDDQKVILIITVIRAIQGSVAIIVPLAVTIVADTATPKIRGFVMVLINVASQIGSVLQSAIQLYFSNSSKYDTRSPQLSFIEVQRRTTLSFRDSHITATCIFGSCLVFVIFFFKESNQRILTIRRAKKLGIIINDNKQMKATPIYKVLFSMVKNVNLDLLFISYFLSLTGATNSRTGAPYYTTRTYGFTNANEAKGYSATVQLVSITIGALITAFAAKPMIKFMGEFRSIILSQYISIVESLVYFIPNPPVPQPLMFLTMFLTGVSLIFCDSIFLQLVSMYSTPQNRGQIMGIFQIANSVGRTLSGALTGAMYDYNYRDSQLFNTMFQSVCMVFLAFITPPVVRTQMDSLAVKQDKELEDKARV